jgi:hypothetical protein
LRLSLEKRIDWQHRSRACSVSRFLAHFSPRVDCAGWGIAWRQRFDELINREEIAWRGQENLQSLVLLDRGHPSSGMREPFRSTRKPPRTWMRRDSPLLRILRPPRRFAREYMRCQGEMASAPHPVQTQCERATHERVAPSVPQAPNRWDDRGLGESRLPHVGRPLPECASRPVLILSVVRIPG